jgi:hypothetical protein
MKPAAWFLLLSLTLLSCNKSDSPTNPSTSNDFVPLPLRVGNTWIYRLILSGQTSYDTCRIINAATINSQLVYVMNQRRFFDKDGFYYDEGFLYGMRVSGPDQKIEIVYPDNPVIGQTWYVYDVSSSFRLEALNESVTVPAGTFSCSRLTVTEDNGDIYSAWMSSGKGVIKMSSGSDSFELISLTLH